MLSLCITRMPFGFKKMLPRPLFHFRINLPWNELIWSVICWSFSLSSRWSRLLENTSICPWKQIISKIRRPTNNQSAVIDEHLHLSGPSVEHPFRGRLVADHRSISLPQSWSSINHDPPPSWTSEFSRHANWYNQGNICFYLGMHYPDYIHNFDVIFYCSPWRILSSPARLIWVKLEKLAGVQDAEESRGFYTQITIVILVFVDWRRSLRGTNSVRKVGEWFFRKPQNESFE